MDSLFFLAGVLAIAVIVWWVVRNDRAAPDAPTTGLLAMPVEKPAAPAPPPVARVAQGRGPASAAGRPAGRRGRAV